MGAPQANPLHGGVKPDASTSVDAPKPTGRDLQRVWTASGCQHMRQAAASSTRGSNLRQVHCVHAKPACGAGVTVGDLVSWECPAWLSEWVEQPAANPPSARDARSAALSSKRFIEGAFWMGFRYRSFAKRGGRTRRDQSRGQNRATWDRHLIIDRRYRIARAPCPFTSPSISGRVFDENRPHPPTQHQQISDILPKTHPAHLIR